VDYCTVYEKEKKKDGAIRGELLRKVGYKE
jgi:hypothetical protein